MFSSFHFIHPLFLWLLPVVFAPILVYFLARQKKVRHIVSSIVFIRRAKEQMAPIHQRTTVLLLMMRSLLIGCIVLLFAEPQYAPLHDTTHTTYTVMVIDTSLSMRARCAAQNNVTLFERAQRIATTLIAHKKVHEYIAVMPTVSLLPYAQDTLTFSTDPAQCSRRVEALEPTYHSAALVTSVAKAAARLDEYPSSHKRIVVISDFSYSTDIQSGMRLRHTSDIELVCFDLFPDTPQFDNALVTRVSFTPVREGTDTTIRANIHTTHKAAVPIHLVVNGEVTQTQTADAQTPVAFMQRCTVRGQYPCAVATADDDLPEDNTRFFVLMTQPRISVLLVDGDPGNSPYQSETFYIAYALHPTMGMSYIETKTISPDEMNDQMMKSYDVVILANVHAAAAALRQWLIPVLLRGKTVVITCGDRIAVNAYRELADVLPCTFTGVIKSESLHIRAQYTSPFVDETIATEYFRSARCNTVCEVIPKSNATVALSAYADRDTYPLLVMGQYQGNPQYGTVCVFTSSLDYLWNNLPSKPVYVSLWHHLVRYTTGFAKDTYADEVRVGQPYWHTFGYDETPSVVRLITPYGIRTLLPSKQEGKMGVMITPNDMQMPGVYTLQWEGNSGHTTALFVVNAVPEETVFNENIYSEFASKVRAYFHTTQYRIGWDDTIETTLQQWYQGVPLKHSLIIAILILLLLELVLMYRRRKI